MHRKFRFALALLALLLLAAATALGADAFRFETKNVTLFEGESAQPVLIRQGAAAEEGELTFTVGKPNILSLGEDGAVTGLSKGDSLLKATLKIGRKTWTATTMVKVLRAVTKVTLSTGKLQIYDPTHPEISGLLEQEPEGNVILLAAGKSVTLSATCTPADASGKKVTYTSSDEGVLKINGNTAKAQQAGECCLTVSSVQNPEVQEQWHVLVTQPVTKLTVTAPGGKTVAVGDSIALGVEYTPRNATMKAVEWSSKNTDVATVDADGVVTGLRKGTVAIQAKALDGSGKTASATITVAQMPTAIEVRESSVYVATGQNAYVHASVLPQSANDRNVTFTSTNPAIATVSASGQVRGVRRGECEIIVTARGNSAVTASIPVQVIQKVTNITFTGQPVSLPVRTTAQLTWTVEPADASIQEVTFSSSNRNVATVDENGVVTGYTRGTATITAAATDGSGRRGQVRVTVTQPVEGVSIQYGVYHVQLEGGMNVKAVISPSNANNQNVHFTVGDSGIATVTDKRNIGHVRGWRTGATTITGTTEDGGYSASAEIRVADFNRAVVVDDVYIENEKIRLVFRNRSDFSVDRVYFTVETWDAGGEPLVCNSDGVSASFDGCYRLQLDPDDRTEHYRFDFDNFVQPMEPIGTVRVTITSWRDTEGYTRNIPEDVQPSQTYHRFLPTPTPSPTPTPAPTATPAP